MNLPQGWVQIGFNLFEDQKGEQYEWVCGLGFVVC
jgi:hypothetical protein